MSDRILPPAVRAAALALVLLAILALFAWGRADYLSGGSIGRMIGGCVGMMSSGMAGGMTGESGPPNRQWR